MHAARLKAAVSTGHEVTRGLGLGVNVQERAQGYTAIEPFSVLTGLLFRYSLCMYRCWFNGTASSHEKSSY